ncbi:MAG: hypothetical protein IAF08_12480 [Rhizobacter sp.]|nr:hypothetical protein [Chlorobiales bacterium]
MPQATETYFAVHAKPQQRAVFVLGKVHRKVKGICRLLEAYLFFAISVATGGSSVAMLNASQSGKEKSKDTRPKIERLLTSVAGSRNLQSETLSANGFTKGRKDFPAPSNPPLLTAEIFYRRTSSDTLANFTISLFPSFTSASYQLPLRI